MFSRIVAEDETSEFTFKHFRFILIYSLSGCAKRRVEDIQGADAPTVFCMERKKQTDEESLVLRSGGG